MRKLQSVTLPEIKHPVVNLSQKILAALISAAVANRAGELRPVARVVLAMLEAACPPQLRHKLEAP